MESPLYLFERQPNSRNVLKVVTLFVRLASLLDQGLFHKVISMDGAIKKGWCDQGKNEFLRSK
jgi:hypothetical protein